MSKVYDYYNQHNSEDPCCPSVMETSNCECGQSEPIKVDMPGFEGTWDALDDITIEHLFLLSHLYYLCIYQQYANQHLSYYYNFDIF